MKRFTSIAVAGLAAVLGFTSVAFADATVYGRVTAGAVHVDNDKDNDDGSWNFGSTGPGMATRIGFKGEQDLGNGMSAGFQIERQVNSTDVRNSDDDGTETIQHFNKRHNLVWLSGGWGKLTLGNQSNPYMKARNWDQTYFYGGNWGHGSSYRHEGISYSMSNGPFSLNVQAIADSGPITVKDAVTTTVHYYTSTPTGATVVPTGDVGNVPEFIRISGTGTCTSASTTTGDECAQAHTIDDVGHAGTARPTASPTTRTRVDTPADVDDSSGIDGWIFHAGYDFGIAAVNVAHQSNETEATDGRNNTAIGFNGSVGALDWYLAHNSSELSNDDGTDNDVSSTGGFLGFSMSDKDTVYAYYVAHSADVASPTLGEDYTETIIGYSRDMGPGLRFIGEYASHDQDLESGADGAKTSRLALAIRYVF